MNLEQQVIASLDNTIARLENTMAEMECAEVLSRPVVNSTNENLAHYTNGKLDCTIKSVIL